jgi:hypothetical protein
MSLNSLEFSFVLLIVVANWILQTEHLRTAVFAFLSLIKKKQIHAISVFSYFFPAKIKLLMMKSCTL